MSSADFFNPDKKPSAVRPTFNNSGLGQSNGLAGQSNHEQQSSGGRFPNSAPAASVPETKPDMKKREDDPSSSSSSSSSFTAPPPPLSASSQNSFSSGGQGSLGSKPSGSAPKGDLAKKSADGADGSESSRGWVFWSLVVVACVLTVIAAVYVYMYYVSPAVSGETKPAVGPLKPAVPGPNKANGQVQGQGQGPNRGPNGPTMPVATVKVSPQGGYVPEKIPESAVADPITYSSGLKQRLFRTNKGLRLYPVGLDGRPVKVSTTAVH